MSLDEADVALLQRVDIFEAGPLVAMPDDKDHAMLGRLVAGGFLTAWPVNARDTLYAITNRGRTARKAR
jgi:hypothetical protein